MIQLELYLKEMSNFLRTLTIKNTFLADHMADFWVKDEYKHVVQDFPELHPYYRNLTGDYILFDNSDLEKAYGVYPDRYDTKEEYLNAKAEIALKAEKYGLTVMSYAPNPGYKEKSKATFGWVPNSSIYTRCNELPIINSFDTQEKIPFTKAILTSTNEINTAEIYKIPNEWYFKLIEKYPTSADIIKAIVYPIKESKVDQIIYSPLERAYNAKNFELLAWDETQLETCEFQSMYECTVNTLDMIRRRYGVKEFCFEDLYPQGMDYLMWNILYIALFVQRIANIRKGSVHSYHLWAYLKSHGLGEYRDILTSRQQNFLYRNLRYLIEHKGTQHAMEILIYVLLTTQNISLQGKNTIQMLDNVINASGEEKLTVTSKKVPAIQSITVGKPLLTAIADMYKADPSVRFQKILEYMGVHAGENTETDQKEYGDGYNEETDTIYKKERSAGLEYQDDYLYDKSTKRCDYLISTSPESYRNTKLLELINSSSSNIYVNLYTKFFAETLIYRIYTGDMKFSISFVPPDSAVKVVLPVADAIGILFYALNKANGNKMPDVFPDADIPINNTGQAIDKFEGEPERIWTKGHRVYKRWRLMDKAPDRFQVEWPYRVKFDGVVRDFPEISETINWHEHKFPTFGMLNSIVTVYNVILNKRTVLFTITDVSASKSTKKYTSEPIYELTEHLYVQRNVDYYTRTGTGSKEDPYVYTKAETYEGMVLTPDTYYQLSDEYYIIEYYSSKGIWVLHDRNNRVLYHSDKPDYFTDKIETLKWYDVNDEQVDLGITINDSKKVLDLNMNNYHGVFHNVTDFSAKAHAQCMDFINLYLENAKEENIVYDTTYQQIIKERYVNEELPIELLGGKKFSEYLDTDDENIIALKSVFDDYDKSISSRLSYSKFVDKLITTIMPIDEALLASSSTVMTDKYKKIVKLFRSMLAYNLAFISSGYKDIDSTLVDTNRSAVHKQYMRTKSIEVTDYYDNCQDHYFESFSPYFYGQNLGLRWKQDDLMEPGDTEDDVVVKQCVILDHIDAICEILDSNLSARTKKSKLKKVLTDPRVTDSQFLISYLMNKPLTSILLLKDTNKKVNLETPRDVIRDIEVVDSLFDESVVVFDSNDTSI